MDLDKLERLANDATPGPWQDVTTEWNISLKKDGVNHGHHGRQTSKNCKASACLIVSVSETNKRIDNKGRDTLNFWHRGYPDWYDLARVIGNPDDAFRWRRGGVGGPGMARQVHCSIEARKEDRAYVAAMHPETTKALIARIRELEAELAKLSS